ncbi:polyketide cyclase [Nocardioides marmoriginsengisoli]|uniref:Polyketide cyclase n=1 Tax=Nocardioides marmoriginsengisoli TaxID=661483 RepID=A0A3N0CI41_9ACTN|nr:SRPBCC family protein [Nocardioides marmoriginsengisoli]RNL62989.1 polyketide cyclase [Nocardioides marmoriginsengisoli]
MSAVDYAFSHTSEVAASPEQVHAVLLDLERYVDWWPQVRAVASAGPDDAVVVCRSRLPYDLELHLHAVSRDPGHLRVEIDGPIRGHAAWTLSRTHNGTRLEFEQRVHAVDRKFVLASYLIKPVLRWNHAVMMRGADEGLRDYVRTATR